MKTFGMVVGAALVAARAAAAEGGELAGDLDRGWQWLAETTRLETQGAFWNDRYGDGEDRWKTGGISQSYIFPERMLSEESWLEGRASALELNLRALVMTPDDGSNGAGDPDDRPFAQYLGVGVYLRSIARPRSFGALAVQVEDRGGVELGWQGEPLPLFEVQDAIHDAVGADEAADDPSDTIGGEPLANLEGRRTWRLHLAGAARDIEIAPFVQGSAGMREVSLRAGADLFIGSALEGRTWGSELATGAIMPGDAPRRDGFHWTAFAGADVGLVAWDAFLGGGFAEDDRSVNREELVARARGGLFLEYGRVGVGFSLNWLSPEFERQPEGQVIGAIQIKYRF